MASQDDKRESLQQLPDDWEQVRFADLFAGGDELELGHAIHRIDMIHPLHPVLVTLMHTVDADIAWRAVGLRGSALADRHARGPRLGPVPQLLNVAGYSLQGNRKTLEGTAHPDRNPQFEHINAKVKRFQHRGQPVISVDTKKKELVGPYKNNGREWQCNGEPERVDVHDFPDPELGKVIPYGGFNLSRNEGWVSVGIDHDTAQFAVQAIGRWWKKMGGKRYPHASALLITADGGGSNGSRCRLWKVALQTLAARLGLPIHVCHFPPGTSKWNKIEHRMFSHITQNWRGRPLVSHEVIVNLIANTTTRAGLMIRAELDRSK